MPLHTEVLRLRDDELGYDDGARHWASGKPVTGERPVRTQFLVFLVVALVLTSNGLTAAQNQPALPPGVLTIEIDGQPIDSLTSPITNSSTPEISGRTDGSLATLELAVANGEIVRFPATIGGSGRFRAVPIQELPDGVYSLYANEIPVGSFTIKGGTPGSRSPGALLDIARVVPYPVDAAQSLPALAYLDGRFFNLTEEAARTAARNPTGPSEGEIERQLAMAGWLQRYENRLAVPNAANPRAFDVQISSFVVEYASGADARTAFDSLNSPVATDFPTLGDESRLVLLSGVTPDTGATYQAARLAFRVGPLLVVIIYADLINQSPDLAVLESLGAAVAERGRIVADRQVVPLGSMALRVDLEGADRGVSTRALYENRAGALTAVFGEGEASRGRRAALLVGTTDAFMSSTDGAFRRPLSNRADRQPDQASPVAEVPAAASSPSPVRPPAAVRLESSLFAFPSESEADTWMANQENALTTQPSETTTFERVSDAPALADAAAVFTMATLQENDPDLTGYRIFARSGTIVAILDIQSAPTVSLRGAVGLMEDQLACIAAQGCAGSVSLPGSIFGARDRPSD